MSERNWNRLSDMPDEILHHILSFLPTPESVRTSVLSSRWRHLWRCVPAFHFDIKQPVSPGNDYQREAVASEAVEKINQFIARRDAACSLLRFHLHVNFIFYYYKPADPISDWISYARSHGVREMSLNTFTTFNPPSVSTFFDLPSIELLDLTHDTFMYLPMLPKHTAPSKLKALTLHDPYGYAKLSLAALFSYCPDLQELTLYRGRFDEVVEITTPPNLRRLTIIDSAYSYDQYPFQVTITCPRLEHLHLSSLAPLKQCQAKIPCLKEASTDLSDMAPQTTKQFTQIFMSLRNVTQLVLHFKSVVEKKRIYISPSLYSVR